MRILPFGSSAMWAAGTGILNTEDHWPAAAADALDAADAPGLAPVRLLGTTDVPESDPDAVGQIDMVLLNEAVTPTTWCALEIQAVYFSGPGMTSQFSLLKSWDGSGIPFPDKVRRPDFRSSGPKRLMPQLQTKVPTLRRWGKKMVVVVDLPFWQSLGAMDRVEDVTWRDGLPIEEEGRVVVPIVATRRVDGGEPLQQPPVRIDAIEPTASVSPG